MRTGKHSGSEVFRGMSVEGPPIRLHRTAAAVGIERALPVHPEPEAVLIARQRAVAEGRLEGRDEGVRAGYEEGLKRGQEDASGQAAQLLERQRAAAEALEQARSRVAAVAHALEATAADWLAAAEDEMVCLCFEALCKLAGDCVARPDAVRAQLLHLMELAGPGTGVEVHVHPQDFAAITAAAGAASSPASPQQGTAWVADAAIASGGCVVHRPGGGLDLRLDAILSEWLQALLAARAQRASRPTPADTNPESAP